MGLPQNLDSDKRQKHLKKSFGNSLKDPGVLVLVRLFGRHSVVWALFSYELLVSVLTVQRFVLAAAVLRRCSHQADSSLSENFHTAVHILINSTVFWTLMKK